MATLTTIRTNLRVKLSDQSSRAFSDAQLNVFINEAQRSWVNYTEEIMQENAYSVTAKQLIYTAPTDIINLKRAEFAQGGFIPLRVFNQYELQFHSGFNLTMSGGFPTAIVLEGIPNSRVLRLWPAPGTSSQTTTCDGAVSDTTAATIEVASADVLRSPAGYVQIDSEKIMYQNLSTSNDNILLCRRGHFGTTAATHSNGATVTQLDLVIMYSRQPAALSADGDIPEISTEYHDILAIGALALALRADMRHAEANAFEQYFISEAIKAKRLIKNAKSASPSTMILGGQY